MVYGADGVLRYTDGVELPLDHDPVTHEAKGVLIEEQRTNLLTYSQAFDNAAWTKIRSSITANATTAPDGTLTAAKLTESVDNATHYLYTGQTLTAVSHTLTCFAKAAERTQISLRADTGSPTFSVFNLSTGEVISSGSGHSASITDVGGGWFRCAIAFTGTAAIWNTGVGPAHGSLSGYQGDGTSGVYVWGTQLEVGAFPTSYIPTTSAQVTRAADNITLATSAFPYNQAEGTIAVEASVPLTSQQDIFVIEDGLAESLGVYTNTSSQVLQWVRDGGVTQVVNAIGVRVSPACKIATAFKANDFAGSLNGAAPSSDTSGTMPTPTKLNLTPAMVVGLTKNRHLVRIKYLPRRATNSELQAMAA